jgi:hypothetical protein
VKAVILQPSYIPWRGYFHQIQKADVFVFYDCVQYDKNGWRNRNKIKTNEGEKWLTVPVNTKGCISEGQEIKNIPIVWRKEWATTHEKSITQNYSKTPFFHKYAPLLHSIYCRRDEKLADFTCATTELIAKQLGISKTKFLRSSHLPAKGSGTDRLISILNYLGAKNYISGPSAKNYIEKNKFEEAGISIEYMAYDYSEYPQTNGPFISNVTILDLILNTGPDAPRYIWQTT